jgi:putative glutamine amidotransferase
MPLHTLSPLYVEGILAVGGVPLQIPNGLNEDALRTVFERVDGLLLSGGGDVDPFFYGETPGDHVYGVNRARDELEFKLVRWALADQKPIFAICRGFQVMNVALGGTLYQDILSDVPGSMQHDFFQSKGYARDYPAHKVQLAPNSGITQLLGGDHFTVNSLHHQGLKAVAPELVPVGHADDGLVEAVEVSGHVCAFGVQWHPEALAPKDPVMRCLFARLVDAAQTER